MKIKNIIRLHESIEQILIGYYYDSKFNPIAQDYEMIVELYLFKHKITFYIIYS